MENVIGFLPKPETIEDRDNQIFHFWEITIMRARITRQLLRPLDWVEIRDVSRQKVELVFASICFIAERDTNFV